MADNNTLTDLVPDLYAAIDRVSRELTGFIPAVSRDSRAERAAKGDTVRVPVTTSESSKSITPSNTSPDSGGNTVNNRTITIDKAKAVEVQFTGEEIMGLQNQDADGADGFENIRQDRFFQAMRTLVNEVESDIAGMYHNAARAHGSAGTAPFGTTDDFSDFAGVMRILDENGAPEPDRQLVNGPAAFENLRGQQTGVLQKANEAGTDEALREGMFGQVHGMTIRHSAQVISHTSGGASGYQTNGTSIASGDTAIPVDTGSGDWNQGDVTSPSGQDFKYVLNAAQTNGGDLSINEPGLESSIADNTSISDPSDYVANMAFHRDAIQLATRMPALPPDGDSAADRTTITDPQTGLSFDIARYDQYRQVHYEIALAWGVDVTKEEWLALLLG